MLCEATLVVSRAVLFTLQRRVNDLDVAKDWNLKALRSQGRWRSGTPDALLRSNGTTHRRSPGLAAGQSVAGHDIPVDGLVGKTARLQVPQSARRCTRFHHAEHR